MRCATPIGIGKKDVAESLRKEAKSRGWFSRLILRAAARLMDRPGFAMSFTIGENEFYEDGTYNDGSRRARKAGAS